ncbi:hypothetical protein ACSBR1_040329 [Camellia fascicularis]
MTITPYDFSIITGLGVGGDMIPFDMDMDECEVAQIYLLEVSPLLHRPAMVQYNWFFERFHGSQPETQKEAEQYTRGFLMYLLGTTLFVNRWNTVRLYLLSALVTLSQVRFYDWGGAGLATLYGYMSSSSRMKRDRVRGYWRAWELWVYAYFLALASELIDEIASAILYLRRYDGRCRCWSCKDISFAFYHRYFDTVVAHETLGLPTPVVLMPPSAFIRIVDSLSTEAIIQYMVGLDADYFRGEGNYTTFIRTLLMPPLTGVHAGDAVGALQEAKAGIGGAPSNAQATGCPAIPTTILCCWPSGTIYQLPIEPLETGHGYVKAPNANTHRVHRRPLSASFLLSSHGAEEGDTARSTRYPGILPFPSCIALLPILY